jgi:hypothetical protein
MHGAVAGGVGDLVMCAMGWMAASDRSTISTIGVHAGMIFPILFALVFTKQAIKNFPARDTDPRFYLFLFMMLGSFAFFMSIVQLKPAKKEKKSL